MTTTTSIPRQASARAIGAAASLCSLYMLWLIVPFFRGQITSPLVSAFNHVAPLGVTLTGSLNDALSNPNSGLASWFCYYVFSVLGFVAAAGFVLLTGDTLSRILLVGWAQFRLEEREAREANERAVCIEAAGERRRERRLKAMQINTSKSDDYGWLLVAGAAFLVWFL